MLEARQYASQAQENPIHYDALIDEQIKMMSVEVLRDDEAAMDNMENEIALRAWVLVYGLKR